MKYCRQLLTCILAAALTLCPFVKETQAKELFDEEELFSYIDEDDFYAARAALAAHEPQFGFSYAGGGNLSTIMDALKEHTGDPHEGDYIARGAATHTVANGNDDWMTASCTAEYYTTAAQEKEMDSAVEKLLKELNVYNKNDYQKIAAVFNWIADNVEYKRSAGSSLDQTGYSALVLGSAVCAGYSHLFYRLMLELGVDCRIVSGTSHGIGHAWNIVRLGSLYYHVDTTFAATSGSRGIWFLRGDDIYLDHDISDSYTKGEFAARYPLSKTAYTPTDADRSTADVVQKPDLNLKRQTMYIGDTLQIKAKIRPSSASQAVTYSSDHPEVASVSQDGVITAKAEGIAYITVTTKTGNRSSECRIRVKDNVIHGTEGHSCVIYTYISKYNAESLVFFRSNTFYPEEGWTEEAEDILGNQYWGRILSNHAEKTKVEKEYPGDHPWYIAAQNAEAVYAADGQVITPDDMSYWFLDGSTIRIFDGRGFDTSKAVSVRGMFENCISLEYADISTFTAKSIKDSTDMFKNCSALSAIVFGKQADQLIPDLEGKWTNGVYTKTSAQLRSEYPKSYEKYAGTWTKIHEHKYAEPTYVWSDDLTEVTASTYCLLNEEHVLSETAVTKQEEIKAPTAASKGLIRYTAVFKNSIFKTQVTESYPDALGPEPTPTPKPTPKPTPTPTPSAKTVDMYRIYNPNSGEHFYTSDKVEKDALVNKHKWKYEGVGWVAPVKSKTPVYRLYNKTGGEHHYTTDKKERDALINKYGWTDEGIGWYSDDNKTVKVYREYNPNAFANNHNYTPDTKEHNALLNKYGWKDEGIAWYAVSGRK